MSATADVSIFDQVGIGTTTPNANELQIGSGSTVIVSAAGSLGVGVTSPVYKLDVYGDINATGFITAGTTMVMVLTLRTLPLTLNGLELMLVLIPIN